MLLTNSRTGRRPMRGANSKKKDTHFQIIQMKFNNLESAKTDAYGMQLSIGTLTVWGLN